MIIEVPLNINRRRFFFAVMAVGASLPLIWGNESSGRCIKSAGYFSSLCTPSAFPRRLEKVLKSEITSTTIAVKRMLFRQERSLK